MPDLSDQLDPSLQRAIASRQQDPYGILSEGITPPVNPMDSILGGNKPALPQQLPKPQEQPQQPPLSYPVIRALSHGPMDFKDFVPPSWHGYPEGSLQRRIEVGDVI